MDRLQVEAQMLCTQLQDVKLRDLERCELEAKMAKTADVDAADATDDR
jgi:hypothetical protein